jgi:hypothetical protein
MEDLRQPHLNAVKHLPRYNRRMELWDQIFKARGGGKLDGIL